MSKVLAEILSSFEKELISIINSKEETKREMREFDEDFLAKYCSNNPEKVEFNKLFYQEPFIIQTGINLHISSNELANEVYNEICKLIKQKEFPVQEILWIRFGGTDIWHFGFEY